MRTIPLALAGMLLAQAAITRAALAQDTPPAPGLAAAAPLPPPAGPRGDHPPPPPPGAAVMLDRGPNGIVHVDVHCARTDTTKDCADIASRLLAGATAK